MNYRYKNEFEKMSKAEMMDMIWDFCKARRELAGYRSTIAYFRDVRDAHARAKIERKATKAASALLEKWRAHSNE